MARNRIEYSIEAHDRASPALRNVAKEADLLGSSFKRLAVQAASAFSVVEIAKYADVWRMTANRIKLVTEGTDELITVQKELVDISAATRSSFESTANLYARVARSSRELGLSQRELLDFSTTVQQSIRVSGSTAAEASAGVIQFGQALASSRLSGDELRSVLEQMPRLAQAIADGMGVGIGTLRELGEQGALTTDVVLDALRKAAPQIEKEFGELAPLVSEAFVVLKSSLMSTIGIVDNASGVSENLARTLLNVAEQIRFVGHALTGQLTAEELEKINIEAKALSASVLGIAFALGTMIDGFQTATGPVTTFFSSLLSRISEVNTIYDGEGFNKAVRIAWEDAGAAIMEGVEENNKDILTSWEELLAKFRNIQGEAFKDQPVDLNKKGDADAIVTRAQRDAIRKAAEEIDKFQEKLFNQADALTLASQRGIEYSEALELVKLQTAGAASGQEELAANLSEAYLALQRRNKEFEANRELEAFQNSLIDQADAMRIAAEMGIDYAQALQVIELQALAATAGNVELGEILTQVFIGLSVEQKNLQDKLKLTEQMAERAAQNMQDAFADFFFDPFKDGLRGLLLEFINVIRQMIAQAAALKFAESINLSGFLKTFGVGLGEGGTTGNPPGRASGGMASGLTLVGERGPELLNLPNGSRVSNNSVTRDMLRGSGEATFVTNIDARGADPGLIARLPQIFEQRDRRLLAAVQRFYETGVMPV